MRGKEKTDIKIDAAESINQLGINEREKALLLVYLFSLPGINACIAIFFSLVFVKFE